MIESNETGNLLRRLAKFFLVAKVAEWNPDYLKDHRDTSGQNFKPLTLFDRYMFCKSYVTFLKYRLDEERIEHQRIQSEAKAENDRLKAELLHLKELFRKNKPLPKQQNYENTKRTERFLKHA